MNIPAKNWTISSLLHPKGRPRSLTRPSPPVSGQFGPVCFKTQSISTLLDLNTTTAYECISVRWLEGHLWRRQHQLLTFYITVAHGFTVFLYANFKIFFRFKLNKRLSTRPSFSCICEMYACPVVCDFALCDKIIRILCKKGYRKYINICAEDFFYPRKICELHLQSKTREVLWPGPQNPLHPP